MPYATLNEMLARFDERELVQLTDQDVTGAIVEARVTDALVEADNLINASVGVRYQLPIAAPVPSLLTDIACDIARYRLYSTAAPEQVRKRYEDARATLDRIAKGTMQLGAAGITVPASIDEGASFSSSERLFTRDSMRGL